MKRFAQALLLVLVAMAPLMAAAADRHSGRVIAIDPAARTLRMEELAEAGRRVERTLRLEPGMTIHLVRPAARPDEPARVDDAHWPNAWDSQPLDAAAVKPGDFVTVTTNGNDVVAMDVLRGE